MIWLIAQMWSLLFAAFFVGLAVGWWIWGSRRSKPSAADLAGSLDADDTDPSKVAAQ